MEVDDNVIALQSKLKEIERVHGTLKLIKHVGGNEFIINEVNKRIYEFLLDKGSQTKNNLLQVLLLNTEISGSAKLLQLNEFAHLNNVLPKVSKLIFINIVLGHEHNCLLENMCSMLSENNNKLFGEIGVEVFESCNDLIANLPNPKQLQSIFTILECIIKNMNLFYEGKTGILLNAASIKNVNNIVGQLLMHLTVHPSLKSRDDETVVHILIGNVFNCLLKLLLMCNIDIPEMEIISSALSVTTCAVCRFVTVEVFCTWAEISEKGESLQYTVSVNAYKVVEKYTKLNSASELISLLACMAKKPKSVAELINQATLETIISKANEQGEHQRRWFKALIETDDTFKNPEALECLSKWSFLCSKEDVLHLMIKSIECHDVNVKSIVLKCASNLSVEDLSVNMTRFFWHHGKWFKYSNLANEETLKQRFVLILNKLNSPDALINGEMVKELQLLMIEDAETIYRLLIGECLRKPFLTTKLSAVFSAIKHVLSVTSECLKILVETIKEYRENNLNGESLKSLWTLLLDTECTNIESLFENVVKLLLVEENSEIEFINLVLNAIKDFKLSLLPLEAKISFAQLLLALLRENRTTYAQFSTLKCELCMVAIDVLLSLRLNTKDFPDDSLSNADSGKINAFYLTWSNIECPPSFLNYLFEDFPTIANNYGQSVSRIIKILPRCVPREWLMITNDLVCACGIDKCAQILTDCLILISEVTNNTNSDPERLNTIQALQYYLKCYGICIKFLNDREKSLVFESNVAKQVCKILAMIPSEIKRQEGTNLISLLSENALKSLSKDKHFVISLTKINDTLLCQTIASKMLEL